MSQGLSPTDSISIYWEILKRKSHVYSILLQIFLKESYQTLEILPYFIRHLILT